jgi:hypothetical protein
MVADSARSHAGEDMHAGIDSRQERTEELGRPAQRPRLRVVADAGEPAVSRCVVAVTLLADDGAEWQAIGGGATVNEALAFAVASAPAGRSWQPVHWLELFGA